MAFGQIRDISGFIPVPPDRKVVSTFSYFDDIEATFESGS